MTWSLVEAVELCRVVEVVCPHFGCHVALTGGTLYKDGDRKDCDLVFYSIRNIQLDRTGLLGHFMLLGFSTFRDHGFVVKCVYKSKPVDLLFPEHKGDGEYRPYPQ